VITPDLKLTASRTPNANCKTAQIQPPLTTVNLNNPIRPASSQSLYN